MRMSVLHGDFTKPSVKLTASITLPFHEETTLFVYLAVITQHIRVRNHNRKSGPGKEFTVRLFLALGLYENY